VDISVSRKDFTAAKQMLQYYNGAALGEDMYSAGGPAVALSACPQREGLSQRMFRSDRVDCAVGAPG
jgi:hypothetical protein